MWTGANPNHVGARMRIWSALKADCAPASTSAADKAKALDDFMIVPQCFVFCFTQARGFQH
jgi:hypothetical protein